MIDEDRLLDLGVYYTCEFGECLLEYFELLGIYPVQRFRKLHKRWLRVLKLDRRTYVGLGLIQSDEHERCVVP